MSAHVTAGSGRQELHVASFTALVLIAGCLAFESAPWHAYPLVLGLGAWYVIVAGPIVSASESDHDFRCVVYLLGALVLLSALVQLVPLTFVLLSVLYTHAFWLLNRMWLATLAVGVGTIAVGFAAVVGMGKTAFGGVLGIGISGFLIATVIGLLVRRQAEQERIRDRLIADLESTRTELAAAHRREGAQGERERLAREIHDTLAQGFTSLIMLIQTADALVESDPDMSHQQLGLAERTARDNLSEARSLVHAQPPIGLEQSNLDGVIRRIAEQSAELGGFDCATDTSEFHGILASNAEIVIMRVTQEAFANIRKHARASCASITLRSTAEGVMLEIIDDGRGFVTTDADGFGLLGMRSRVEEASGAMTINSTPGSGTRIRVIIP